MGDLYSNTDLAGKINSNFKWKNTENITENSFEENLHLGKDSKLSKKIDISINEEIDFVYINEFDDFAYNRNSLKNNIKYKSDQNMRNFVNENEEEKYENEEFTNKNTKSEESFEQSDDQMEIENQKYFKYLNNSNKENDDIGENYHVKGNNQITSYKEENTEIPEEEIQKIEVFTPKKNQQPNPYSQSNHNIYNESLNNSKYIPLLEKYQNQTPLEYIQDIWKNMRQEEKFEACKSQYEGILNQFDITFDMRAVLIDWIIDAHANWGLLPETLHLCISIIDRYISKEQIQRNKFQLLGTTALFIASKYEQIAYNPLEDFAKITDDAYKKEDILDMEIKILKALDYDITYPSVYRFFEIISLNYNFSEVELFFGSYLIDYFLISPFKTKFQPSIIALATVLLILRLKNYENYHDLYNLTEEENRNLIKNCAKEIFNFPEVCDNLLKLTSVKNKYSKAKYHYVALQNFGNHFNN